jgi:F0F1-type ATP synthase assembly protein I
MVLLKDVEAAKQLVALGYVESDDGTYTLQEPTISYKAYCVDMNDHDAIDAHMGILGKHRASKKDTQAWIELKQSWAQQFADDPQGYEDAKKAYFEQIAPEAREKNRREQKLGSSMAIGMCLGMGIGVALGSAMGNIGVGMCIGISVGMCLGLALGAAQTKKDGDKHE